MSKYPDVIKINDFKMYNRESHIQRGTKTPFLIGVAGGCCSGKVNIKFQRK